MESEGKAQQIINAIPLGVITFESDFTIIRSNPRAREILIDSNNIADALNRGSNITVLDKWQELLSIAIASGESHTFDNFMYTNNNKKVSLHIICTPLDLTEPDEKACGILTIEDVTTRAMMEEDLASAQRLASVGKLAAKIAHELNNPLDGILRYLNLSMRIMDESGQDKVGKYLQESRKGLLRMVKIISELLEFSRSTYSACEEADVNKIITDSIKAMEHLAIEHNITISLELGKDMPNLRTGNLFQVFCNLIKNGIDSMASSGELKVISKCNDKSLTVQFLDTGSGLSQEVLEKLFEPFFTTKSAGKGTGLGLPICKDIIEKYNGHLTAQNRSDCTGSIFTVTIPSQKTSWMVETQE